MEAMELSTEGTAESESTFLTFRLGANRLGLELDRVEEILRLVPTTPVPLTPPWIRGVFNLRGRVLPAVDLGVRLGFSASTPTTKSCLLLLKMTVEGLEFSAGIIVDEVLDLVSVATSEIKPPPTMGVGIKLAFVRGIVERDETPLLFLDVVRVFKDDELLQIALTDQRLRNQVEAHKAEAIKAARLAKAAKAAEPSDADDANLDWGGASDDGVHLFSEE